MDKSKNVFISHYNRDEEHIQNLKALLEKRGYKLKNSSIDSTKPNQASNDEYIKRLLRLRIQWAGTFIVLIGKETHKREWVNWEIEQAAKKGKRIVGVHIEGEKDSDIPDNFHKLGDALVGWTSEKIIDAIEGKINNWETPEGQPYQTPYSTSRPDC